MRMPRFVTTLVPVLLGASFSGALAQKTPAGEAIIADAPCADEAAALASADAALADADAAVAAAEAARLVAQQAYEQARDAYEAAFRRYEFAWNTLMGILGGVDASPHVAVGVNDDGLTSSMTFGAPGASNAYRMYVYFDNEGLDLLGELMSTDAFSVAEAAFEAAAVAALAADERLEAARLALRDAEAASVAAAAARAAAEAHRASAEAAYVRCLEATPTPVPPPEAAPEAPIAPAPSQPPRPACVEGAQRNERSAVTTGRVQRVFGIEGPRLGRFRTARGAALPEATLPGIAGYCDGGVDVLTPRLAATANATAFTPNDGRVVIFDGVAECRDLQLAARDELHDALAGEGYDAARQARYVYWLEIEHDGAWSRDFRTDREDTTWEICLDGTWQAQSRTAYTHVDLGCQPVKADNPMKVTIDSFGTLADHASAALDAVISRKGWVVGPCQGCP